MNKTAAIGITKMAIPKKPKWRKLEHDVVARIRALEVISSDKVNMNDELRDKVWDDLVMPNLELLAEFCGNVDLDELG